MEVGLLNLRRAPLDQAVFCLSPPTQPLCHRAGWLRGGVGSATLANPKASFGLHSAALLDGNKKNMTLSVEVKLLAQLKAMWKMMACC